VKLEKLWRGEEISGIGSPISVSPPDSGEIQFEPDDLSKASSDLHRVTKRVGLGGKRIDVHTGHGRIVIR
jgi:hypothetical protein